MNSDQILNIIDKGEGINTEFKKSFNDDAIISLTAFANSKGGKLFIGISDTKQITGLDLGKETIQNWMNEIKIKLLHL